jgi:tripartite-type tricarboxylate transporter receptor subunit TctC
MKLISSLAVALGAVMALSSPAAAEFPDRPITIIVPWAAGGGTDAVARIFAAGFEKEIGQPINVINRAGGNGVAGHSAIMTAKADGYTLGIASPEIAYYKTLGTADITPASFDLFSRLAILPAGITVSATSPYKTLDDLLKAVKDQPAGTLSASGTGTGGSWHVAIGGLLKAAGLESTRVKWVPSQGGAPAVLDVGAGGITRFSGSPVEAQALLEAGKVRTIAMMTEERVQSFPDVATTKEAKVDWQYANWFALVGPRDLPKDVREKLNAAAERAQARPEVQEGMKKRGITPVWDAKGAAAAYVDGFAKRGVAVLKDLGLARE